MLQHMEVTRILCMEENNVDKQSSTTWRYNRPTFAYVSTYQISNRQSIEGKTNNLLETSFIIVEHTTLTTKDLVNVVVSNPLST
jgi:hypothetical protein